MRVEVLGPLRVLEAGIAMRLRPAQRRLLSVLLLEAGMELDRDVLIDRMWGEAAPATASTALQVHVSGLRRAAPGLVLTTALGYAVELDGLLFDRTEFDESVDRAAARADEARWMAAIDALDAGLRLWRGVPFAELGDDDFSAPEINRLSERRLALLELRARALLALERHEEASQLLRGLVAAHPLRESVWEKLMLALDGSGRRADALRAFQEVRRILAEDLAIEPAPSLQELNERILAGDPHPGRPVTVTSGPALPSVSTSFVGREDDLQTIGGLLAGERIVTIVGGPGMGKTRLAVEIASALADRYPAGVWFASLAAARTPPEIIGAIVAATGLRDHRRTVGDVARRLAGRPGLLILDNCEHQLECCSEFVGQSLAVGTALTFLATSRRPLGVDGEKLWPIHPLAPPVEQRATPSGTAVWAPVAASPAVQLFVDRARGVDRSFRLTDQTAPAVAELCRRAEGIPLVLELAARWVQALGLDDITDMLGSEPPGSPAGELDHHRSLAAAIEWSMTLLPPEDRRLFILSALFSGSFGLDDVQAVCAPHQERRRLARAVAGLAEASLIIVERQPDGKARYRMLGPIREVARSRLADSVDWSAARGRLATHYLSKPYVEGDDPLRQVVDLARIDTDIDNLRQAFGIGLEMGRAEDVALNLVRLEGYWLNRYLVTERGDWLGRVLEQVSEPVTRAHVLRCLGSGAQVLSDLDASLDYFQQALPAFRQSSDRPGLAQCLLSLSGLLAMRGEWPGGLAAAHEAGQIASEVGSMSGLAVAAYYVGENLAYGGDLRGGAAQLEEAARLFQNAGEVGRAAYALSTLTSVLALGGEAELGNRVAPRALALAEQSQSVYRRVRALGAAGLLEARYGDPQIAGRLLVETHDLMEPYELDDVFIFLLPSAFLVRRWKGWELLAEMLAGAEMAIARSRVGYPEPWREVVQELRRELAAVRGAVTAGASARHRTVEEIGVEVLAFLRQAETVPADLPEAASG